MDVGAALKSRLGRMLEPLGGPPLAAGFDLVARLGSDGDHRIWFKALRDSDPTRTAAFRRLAEAGRLTRPLWQWGSDLFVALVPGGVLNWPTSSKDRSGPGPGWAARSSSWTPRRA